ncbi:MAG: hypothetical protein ACFE9N_15385 [Promethearchaeota archaeon]
MTESNREIVMKNLSPEKRTVWEKQYNLVKDHPDAQGLENVKLFAQSIINDL